MGKDDSVVKSFRTTEEQFEQANEIFRKEGFNFSEVIRLLFDATIKEGRIPRGLSTRDMEDQLDAAKQRDDYIGSILNMAIPNFNENYASAEEKLLSCIFGKEQDACNMSNAELRDWADKWGLPDNLSIATLADLYDCGLFVKDPWFGDYNYSVEYEDDSITDIAVIHRFEENLKDNISQMARKMQIKAVNTLMDYDKVEDEKHEN